MKQILVCITVSAVLVVAGCSTGPRRGAPAPVVRSQPAPVTSAKAPLESRAAPESISYPARDTSGTEIIPYATAPGAAEITPYSSDRPNAAEITAAPSMEPAAPVRSNNTAVLALLSSAGSQQQGGDMPGAAATLERALRIEPRNARLWHRLASLRLEQKQYRMAADLADKSNSLAPEDDNLRRANWRLIARSRSALGDSKGAQQAWEMAR